MSALKNVNPQADVIGSRHALLMNITAAKGLADVLKSNLGPKGTMKMLVGGAGQIKITKDGKVLLDEMQIQHPTAVIIARTATAQDDMTGDGTTSNVLFTGELLSQSERLLQENVHPRVIVDGIEQAREYILKFLDENKINLSEDKLKDREFLSAVARTALKTKLTEELGEYFVDIIVNAIQCIQRGEKLSELDLHMVEIMTMKHENAFGSRFIDGLVLDHGVRHPDMSKKMENVYILNLNDSLEYEKSEINAGFFYKDAEQRTKLAVAERKVTDDKVKKIIEFKRRIFGDDKNKCLVVINQKGIDPLSLDALAREGIAGIRRAKRRNAERLQRSVGGYVVTSVDDLSEDCLGYAEKVYEHTIGDDKFTFIEGCRNPTSCTILIKGPNDHTIKQLQDAVHDGLRAVKSIIDDKSVLLGAGCFELQAYHSLMDYARNKVIGRSKLGVEAFANALLIIPKVLASNSGLDQQQSLIDLIDETRAGHKVGLDLSTGKSMLPDKIGVYDSFRSKKQLLHLGSMMAINLLLVDEVIRAGKKMGGK